MKKWVTLVGAIGAEVTGTMLLRASVDDPRWAAGVVIAYICAFALLGLTLRWGMPIGIAYGIWGAVGVALTAILGTMLFDEVLGGRAVLGIGVIVVGVLIVETGGRAAGDRETEAAAVPEAGR